MYTFMLAAKADSATKRLLRIEAIHWDHRQIPLSHGRHIIGYRSPGAGRPLIPFESAAEGRAIDFLLKQPGVHFVLSQPFTIDYRWRGQSQRYTPDFLVASQPVCPALRRQGFGHLSVIEIKPAIGRMSRGLVDARLQVVNVATGLPALLGMPASDEVVELFFGGQS